MIGDRMIIRTRRSEIAGGDPDNTGWRFSTEGLGSFGQLVKVHDPVEGTQVRLRLKSPYVDDLGQFYNRLRSYVVELLAYLPCPCDLALASRTALSRAWCRGPSRIADLILHDFRSEPSYDTQSLLPAEEVERRKETDLRWIMIRDKAKDCLRHTQPVTGELPDRCGRYRLHLCYFDIEGHASLAFIDVAGEEATFLPRSAHIKSVLSRDINSLNGFAVEHANVRGEQYPIGIICELDWAAGRIDVARRNLEVDYDREKVRAVLRDVLKSVCVTFLAEEQDSRFAALNYAIVAGVFEQERFSIPGKFCAAAEQRDGRNFKWSDVEFSRD
jgi:hypothetical protein